MFLLLLLGPETSMSWNLSHLHTANTLWSHIIQFYLELSEECQFLCLFSSNQFDLLDFLNKRTPACFFFMSLRSL